VVITAKNKELLFTRRVCPPSSTKAGGTHSPGGEGGGGSIFWKTQDIGLASYSNNLSTARTHPLTRLDLIFFYYLISSNLADHLGDALAVPVVEVVEGEHVVHAAASHHVPARGEHRRHHPC
jgi:hypothetical protein